MVAVRSGRRLDSAALDAGDVPGHVDLEPLEQRRERAVQVVAVAAATREHTLDTGEGIDVGRTTAVDVDVLPHDPLDVRASERCEHRAVDTSWSGFDVEVGEVRSGDPVGQPGHGEA